MAPRHRLRGLNSSKISKALCSLEIVASPNTVARLLKGLGYRLRVNRKKIARVSHADRDLQSKIPKPDERRSSCFVMITVIC